MSSRPNRETAYRVFATEFDDATLSYAESDEERAPNYVVTPTGARLNRLFAVGVLTEIESVNDDQLRARVVDPTGAFVVYAGQYQPEALSALERLGTPAFVAVTGKARTFQPEDSNRVFTSIRPENLGEVDAATRDRFAVEAARRTLERVRTMREALARDERGDALGEALEAEGVEAGLAAGVPRALDHYGTTSAYLDVIEGMALDAVRVVAGEREEVEALDVAPDERARDAAEPADRGADSATTPADPTEESAAETAVETGRTAVADDGESTAETRSTEDSPAAVETEPSGATDSTPEAGESESSQTTAESPQPDAEGEVEGSADDSLAETDESDEEVAAAADGEAVEADLDDPEEFELDADERERIEEEFGTDFESASEVDGPGEADIETPTPDDASDHEEETEPTAETTDPIETTETDTTGDTEPPTATDDPDIDTDSEADDAEDEPAAADPEEAVVAAMAALDDGDGVAREAVVERAVDEHGLTREQATDGIQSALMSGECYEPDDDTLKPI